MDYVLVVLALIAIEAFNFVVSYPFEIAASCLAVGTAANLFLRPARIRLAPEAHR